MSRQSNPVVEGLIPGKIRKRGCSSSPSSSSKVYNYRFKRAIMMGKTRAGVGSRSSTPAPSWRMMPSSKLKHNGEGGFNSPDYDGGGGRSKPVSARKLAATLWEVNQMPSPQNLERRRRRVKDNKRTSGSIPLYLSDPSHSPVSERMDRSGTGSHLRASISNRPGIKPKNVEVFYSHSNNSLMEIETRSQVQTPNGSVNGFKPRLKEVSNALTTSKELLKIIHRMWAHDNIPSSSMSLISALHSELERARLQVNHIIKDQQVDRTEVNGLLKHFDDQKALWKNKEKQAVEQLEVEKKLRRRSESLNKKLGQELAETKASFDKVVKELASEKQARVIMDQVCEDRAEAEVMKQKPVNSLEEVEKEREMIQLVDKLRDERVQMKITEAKNQFEEKSALVDKLRSQLETVIGNKLTGNKNARRKDEDLMMYLHKCGFNGTRLNEEDDDGGEVEDDKDLVDEMKWRNSVNELVNRKALRRSCSIQRSISDGNEYGNHDTFVELEKHIPRRSHGDDLQRFKSVKGLRDRILTKLKSRDFEDSGHGNGSKSRGETFSGRRSKK